jgi:predicted transposase YdaD
MRYDVTLRSLIGHGAPALLGAVVGVPATELLSGEFQTARERRADVVARLADGRLLHLELQTGTDPAMPWRMLEYHALIAAAHGDSELVQVVLHVGNRPAATTAGLVRAGLSFQYRVVDIRDLDPDPLLASPAPADAVLAFLARCDDIVARTRAVLARLASLPEPAWRDATAQLLVLSGLRGAADVVLKEIKTMPIQIEIEDNPFLRDLFLKAEALAEARGKSEGKAEGKSEGKAEALLRLLERRFGPLAPGHLQRIRQADLATLDLWFDRAIDAPDLVATFCDPLTH